MSNSDQVLLTFPPRPISQWERALVAEWFAATQRDGLDVARAFVSERRGDDPRFLGKIVVVMQARREPSFLVHSPRETAFWVVTEAPLSCVLLRQERPDLVAVAGSTGTLGGHLVEPPTQQRLALGVDEDVRPPERVLDELEPLGGDPRREAPDALEPGEDRVVAGAVGMAHEGRVHP